MNYLVTGAAGFIGAAIVERLLRGGNTCTTIDNLSTGSKEHIPSGCKFILGDVSDSAVIDGLNDYCDRHGFHSVKELTGALEV